MDNYQLPILFDRPELADQSIAPAVDPIETIRIDDIKLQSALELALREKRLTFEVRDDFVWVTTLEAAATNLVTRVYRRRQSWRASEEQVANTIVTAASPNSWEDNGGLGSISLVEGGLVITNSYGVHDQIDKLFAKLDCLYAGQQRAEGRKRPLPRNSKNVQKID